MSSHRRVPWFGSGVWKGCVCVMESGEGRVRQGAMGVRMVGIHLLHLPWDMLVVWPQEEAILCLRGFSTPRSKTREAQKHPELEEGIDQAIVQAGTKQGLVERKAWANTTQEEGRGGEVVLARGSQDVVFFALFLVSPSRLCLHTDMWLPLNFACVAIALPPPATNRHVEAQGGAFGAWIGRHLGHGLDAGPRRGNDGARGVCLAGLLVAGRRGSCRFRSPGFREVCLGGVLYPFRKERFVKSSWKQQDFQ